MFLGVMLICAAAQVDQCSVMVNTEELYLTEKACMEATSSVAYDAYISTGLPTRAMCYKMNSVGQPL